jgi:hypothetical protein
MQTRMFNFFKILLEKVSFDQRLLNKEYKKCLNYLNEREREKLTFWASFQDFSNQIPGPKEDVRKNTG